MKIKTIKQKKGNVTDIPMIPRIRNALSFFLILVKGFLIIPTPIRISFVDKNK